MPNGHYDEDAGVCYPDEITPGAGSEFPYMDKPDSVPEECWSPLLGIDWDCMNRDTLSRLLGELWDCITGESD